MHRAQRPFAILVATLSLLLSAAPASAAEPPPAPPSEGPPIIVEGLALDPQGAPLAIVYAEGIVSAGGESQILPVETGADGSFRVDVPAPSDPELERLFTVQLIGPDVRTVEDDEGCLITHTLVARGLWTLVGALAPEPVTLVAVEEPLSGVCGGATATPAVGVPQVTLPPTDTGALTEIRGSSGLAAAMFMLATIALAATLTAVRRVSRRGS